MSQDQVAKDTVQNLQRLYAVIVGLAIGEAAKKFFALNLADGPRIQWGESQEFLAFIATVVPFFHGMNRHLERSHVEEARSRFPKIFLVLDFYAFFGMSLFFLALSTQIGRGLMFFKIFAYLFTFDLVWAILIILLTKDTALKWWIVLDVISIVVLGCLCFRSDLVPSWAPRFPFGTAMKDSLSILAIVRTGFDYWLNRDLYFPGGLGKPQVSAGGPVSVENPQVAEESPPPHTGE